MGRVVSCKEQSKLWCDGAMHICALSHARFFVTPWTVTRQAPLSMVFSRQDYWSGWPFPTPGDLSYPGIESTSLLSPALAGSFFTTGATWENDI